VLSTNARGSPRKDWQAGNDAHATEQKELQGRRRGRRAPVEARCAGQSLQSAESAEKGNALRALQDQHLVAQLSTASIRSATIYGIGQALRSALIANGITTAADFTGFRMALVPKCSLICETGVEFIRAHRRGEAVALETWRREVEARARRTQPTSLPPAQVQAIRLKYAQRRQTLAQEEHRARAEAASQQHEIRERWATIHAALGAELSGTRDRFPQERLRRRALE